MVLQACRKGAQAPVEACRIIPKGCVPRICDFEPDVHRALRLRAAANDRSISDMVNDAVRS